MDILKYLSVGEYIDEKQIKKLPRTRSRLGVACAELSKKLGVKTIRRDTGSRVSKYRIDILDQIFKYKDHNIKRFGYDNLRKYS